jgi:hypothetical protein
VFTLAALDIDDETDMAPIIMPTPMTTSRLAFSPQAYKSRDGPWKQTTPMEEE